MSQSSIKARAEKPPNGRKLTQFEEDSLVGWIFSMDKRGAAPRKATKRNG